MQSQTTAQARIASQNPRRVQRKLNTRAAGLGQSLNAPSNTRKAMPELPRFARDPKLPQVGQPQVPLPQSHDNPQDLWDKIGEVSAKLDIYSNQMSQALAQYLGYRTQTVEQGFDRQNNELGGWVMRLKEIFEQEDMAHDQEGFMDPALLNEDTFEQA
ncbi:hypothetical protein BKA67DRAFT_541835 [Truncatella angustata]|uniref:Uncharacterized protein n=1 Tax=Truncatella angustata TaxID=152316 RepID=A0A9P8RM56_9PEZI|nr:uncharacterized protein BKA67DRAFT_541835 [Truncatella angustata]KAH6645656.1 hypothetical protein BKA67DRAFT_541835 [Truncatella angustata]